MTVRPGLDRSRPAPRLWRRSARHAVQIVARAALDCAYLIRSRHPRRTKARILLEYVRLTIKLIFNAHPDRAGSERVLCYRVRHFGYGSLQFLFREVFVRNEYFFETVNERPLILDCGANIGLATLFFKWLYPRCEVHAFEPDPCAFAALKDNVEQNGLADVHLHNVALCDANGAVDFFVPQRGSASPMMSLVRGRIPEAESRRIVVDGRTLSTYIDGREVDFLKMDIEGGEELVLRELAGAGVLRRVKEMVVEYHHNLNGAVADLGRFLQLLRGAGYHYQLDATRGAPGSATEFQDILVCAHHAPGTQGDRESGA